MKALVTGASGFIGKHLVPKLIEQNYQVRTFGRSKSLPEAFAGLPIEHVQGDIANAYDVDRAISGCDLVFHMAGLVSYRRQDQKIQWEANVTGTQNVMSAALQANVKRVIYTSSIAAMGIPAPGTLGDETIVYNLSGRGLNYCDSKHQAEVEAEKFAQKGLCVVTLCPGIILGEGDTHPHHHALFGFLKAGKLLGFPPGGVTFSDINDVVLAHLAAVQKGRCGQRYVVGSQSLSFREAILIVSSIIGCRPPKRRIPGKALDLAAQVSEIVLPLLGKRPQLTRQIAWLAQQNIYFSSQKAVSELGLKQTAFAQTVARTAPYYMQGKNDR